MNGQPDGPISPGVVLDTDWWEPNNRECLPPEKDSTGRGHSIFQAEVAT